MTGKTEVTSIGGGLDESREPVMLADAATLALTEMMEGDTSQPAFDGLDNVTKIRFTGMAFDSVDDEIKLGDEISFLVRSRCTAETKETLKDGHVRNIRRMDVQSVLIKE